MIFRSLRKVVEAEPEEEVEVPRCGVNRRSEQHVFSNRKKKGNLILIRIYNGKMEVSPFLMGKLWHITMVYR